VASRDGISAGSEGTIALHSSVGGRSGGHMSRHGGSMRSLNVAEVRGKGAELHVCSSQVPIGLELVFLSFSIFSFDNFYFFF
jgi:hypothetical protein